MRFSSTRGADDVSFSQAMQQGLASDGGLFVPERFPTFDSATFDSAQFDGESRLADLAAVVLAPFFEGDPLAEHLPAICARAMSFPTPLVCSPGHEGAAILELFHGPTAAFKDVGARFLAECFAHLPSDDSPPRHVLVATSGDTGGAVASAFEGRTAIEVVILFPDGGVSPEQRHQLTCWGDNVHSFAVRGTFDDCQRVVKQAFADDAWRKARRLTTANSINVARLLPQVAYYAHAALASQARFGASCTFFVPSGNLGNATAGLWARQMGFPIERVVMVTNRNRAVPDYLATGDWRPRPSQPTLANAMDVGDPSNMERILHLFPGIEELREQVSSFAVSDEEIGTMIASGPSQWSRIFDPHTATAAQALTRHPEFAPAVLVATAHPAKFKDVVEPRIGCAVPVPEGLERLLARETRFVRMDPDLQHLERAMDLGHTSRDCEPGNDPSDPV